MAESSVDGYKKLTADVKAGSVKNLYVFHGEEKYLLEYSLGMIREKLLPEGLEEFNHKKFDGKITDVSQLRDAVDALPVFCDRTLIEIRDFDFFKQPEAIRKELVSIVRDIPEYVCLILIFDTVPYAVDKRSKENSELASYFEIVEFKLQPKNALTDWIRRRYKPHGKTISAENAEYLIFMTGGLMTRLIPEIEKTAAYEKGEEITKASIDALVDPVLEAASYKMTDALVRGKFDDAASILDKLLTLQEAPRLILHGVTLKYRQLTAARAFLNEKRSQSDLRDTIGVKDYPAQILMQSARNVTIEQCRESLDCCARASLVMNTSSDEADALKQLIAELAFAMRRRVQNAQR